MAKGDRMSAKQWRQVGLVAVCGLLFFTGALMLKMSLQEAKQDQLLYCRMVWKGMWPDFHHSYWTECAPYFGPPSKPQP